MSAHKSSALAAVLLVASVTGAFAQGVSANLPVIQGRSVAVSPECCNPAANTHRATRPPGVYVGMPLQSHDLGYNPTQPER